MTQPIIKFDKVVKAFGSFVVLNQLDFEVQPGEKVTIIGPSGSGKSTVLRILMTSEAITGGVVYVDGQPFKRAGIGRHLKPAGEAHLRRCAKRWAWFSSSLTFPHMTVRRNITEAPVGPGPRRRKRGACQ